MRAKTFALLLTCGLLISACGFKLRGMADIPIWLNNMAVISEVSDTGHLIPVIKTHLKNNRILINDEPSLANYWLMILAIKQEERISGVAASTTPRQYELTLSVDFQLRSKSGNIIQKPAKVSVTRTVTVNENRILGSNSETRIIVEEMQEEIALQIINRLAVSR